MTLSPEFWRFRYSVEYWFILVSYARANVQKRCRCTRFVIFYCNVYVCLARFDKHAQTQRGLAVSDMWLGVSFCPFCCCRASAGRSSHLRWFLR